MKEGRGWKEERRGRRQEREEKDWTIDNGKWERGRTQTKREMHKEEIKRKKSKERENKRTHQGITISFAHDSPRCFVSRRSSA